MYKFQIVVLLGCIFSALHIKGQSVLTEFSLSSKKIENIQSYVSSDNIYLFYDEHSKSGLIHKTYQIKPDGTSKELFLKHLENTLLVGVKDYGMSTWLYYLTGKKNELSLKAMIYTHGTMLSEWLDEEVEINGKILGISNDETLSIISYEKELNQLRIQQMDHFMIVTDKSFDLPVDLINDYKYITYIPDDQCTTIEQGSAKFKLYKRNKQLILSTDYTFYESSFTTPQTSLMIFNMETGDQSIKKFETKTKSTFRSFVYNDKLYRAYTSRKVFKLEVLNISNGELIQKREIIRDTILRESFVYIRNEKTHRISKKESMYNMMSTSNGCDPSVIVLPEMDSCATLIWSTYYADKDVGIFFFTPLMGLLTPIVAAAVMQIKKPTDISRYFYMKSNRNLDDENKSTIKPKRQLIDEYEITFDEKRMFNEYKTYFAFQKSTIGLYYSSRLLKLTLVKY